MARLTELIDEYNRTKRQAGEPVMTQRRLAELTDVAEATVSRHVNGTTDMGLKQAIAYAQALKIDLSELEAA